MGAGTWSQFGNSMIRPVTLISVPSPMRPTQNQPFSPALKRPDGTSLPENMPPKRMSHARSPRPGRFQRTKMTASSTMLTMKRGPMKLCRFFMSIVSHANSV